MYCRCELYNASTRWEHLPARWSQIQQSPVWPQHDVARWPMPCGQENLKSLALLCISIIPLNKRITTYHSSTFERQAHLCTSLHSEFHTLSSGLYSTTAHGTAVPPGPTFHYSGFFRKLRINKKIRLAKVALNLESIIIWSWLSKCIKRINASRLLPSPCVKVWKEYMKEE